MTKSVDPDQFASEEANWSGSTLFAKTGHVLFSKRRVKASIERPAISKHHYDVTESLLEAILNPKNQKQKCFRSKVIPLLKSSPGLERTQVQEN